MGVKGVSAVIVIPLILLAIVFAIVSTDVTFFFEKGVTKEANIQATTYTMWNALQAADFYEDISLDYAAYQACYDILRRGGFREDNRNWSNSGDATETPPGDDEFKSWLFSLVQEYVNRYTDRPYNFVEGYNVTSESSQTLPDIRITFFDINYEDFKISAESVENMFIRNEIEGYNEDIVLKKGFEAEKTYEIPCFGLFYWAKNNNHEEIKVILKEEVEKEIQSWPLYNEKQYSESCDFTENRIDEVRNEIFYEVVKDILAPEIPMGGYVPPEINKYESIQESVDKIKSNIDIGISVAIYNIDMSVYRYYVVPHTESEIFINPKCIAEENSEGCYYSCDFEYNAAVTLKTEFHQDEEVYYPVAPDKFPEFDTMKLIITDRMTYTM